MDWFLEVSSWSMLIYVFFFSNLLPLYYKHIYTPIDILCKYYLMFYIPVVYYILYSETIHNLLTGLYVYMSSVIISIAFFIMLVENTIINKKVAEVYRLILHLTLAITSMYTPYLLLLRMLFDF